MGLQINLTFTFYSNFSITYWSIGTKVNNSTPYHHILLIEYATFIKYSFDYIYHMIILLAFIDDYM